LHAGEQQGRPDESQIGNAGQHGRSLVLATFHQPIASHLPAQCLQPIQLLEQALGTISLACLQKLG